MRRFLVSYIMGILFLFITIVLTSIITTSLTFAEILPEPTFSIVLNIIAALLFLMTGLLVGFLIRNRGWLHGLILAFLYLAIAAFIIKQNPAMTFVQQLNVYIRSLMLVLGAILGVNFRK